MFKQIFTGLASNLSALTMVALMIQTDQRPTLLLGHLTLSSQSQMSELSPEVPTSH